MRPRREFQSDKEKENFKRDWYSFSYEILKRNYGVKSNNTLKRMAAEMGLPPKYLTQPEYFDFYLMNRFYLFRYDLSELKRLIISEFLVWVRKTFNQDNPIIYQDFMGKFDEWRDFRKITLSQDTPSDESRKLRNPVPADNDLCNLRTAERFLIDPSKIDLDKIED